MEILLKRIAKRPKYTIGKLYVDGKYMCDTIEDTDRGLNDSMAVEDILKIKVYRETAIPMGKYEVTLNITSPSFYKKDYYRDFCGGKMPRLLNVKGFEGILIHRGTNQNSSAGCIIVGDNTIIGQVTNSTYRFEQLYKLLKTSKDKIYITITD